MQLFSYHMLSLVNTETKDETKELREMLEGNDHGVAKFAAKKVLSMMRAGENVSHLFAQMLKLVNTDDIELKKITYYYLVNYSVEEPEQAIMAVNTFVRDSQHKNPIIRALAVRNMCRIKLESVAENMIIPVKQCLADKSPYVRKTAAFGVAKLYDIVPYTVENASLLQDLLNLLKDSNPLVVSNAMAAVFAINQHRASPLLILTAETVIPLLSAINESNEWCQVALLDALAEYIPESPDHAESLIDRLIPFLKQTNPAVIIGAFKCIFAFMDYDPREPGELFSMIIPPFMSLLLASDYEIQFVVLRTLSLFVVKYPHALSREISVFFCKYNDPPYIKMEKLDIIMATVQKNNAKTILDELSEYCNAIDVAFVKKAIKSIGQIALKFESTSLFCVDKLMALVDGKADYAAEETIIVMCDILRRYPGKYESVIAKICSNIETIKEPKARSCLVWIIGEYCDKIQSVDVILDPFVDTFHDEQPIVQLQILTALVKVFIFDPDLARDQLQYILNEASQEDCVTDVRNHALMYWRILTTDVQLASDIVIFSKETVLDSGIKFDDKVFDELIRNMGKVAGVLHEIPSAITKYHSTPTQSIERRWQQVHLEEEADFLEVYFDIDKSKLYIKLVNLSDTSIKDLGFSLSKNSIGLVATNDRFPPVLPEDGSVEAEIPIKIDSSKCGKFGRTHLEFLFRTNYGQISAYARIPLEIACQPSGKITQEQYRQFSKAFPNEIGTSVENAVMANEEDLFERCVYVVGQNQGTLFVSFKLPSNALFVGSITQSGNNVNVMGVGSEPELQPLIESSARYLFCQK